jgi:hypothetical protein
VAQSQIRDVRQALSVMGPLSSSEPLFETIRVAQVHVLDYAAYYRSSPTTSAVVDDHHWGSAASSICRRYFPLPYLKLLLQIVTAITSRFPPARRLRLGTLDPSGICEGFMQR